MVCSVQLKKSVYKYINRLKADINCVRFNHKYPIRAKTFSSFFGIKAIKLINTALAYCQFKENDGLDQMNGERKKESTIVLKPDQYFTNFL